MAIIRLTGEEKSKFERLFEVLTVRPIPEPIIRKAIDLRRRRRGMATVDAVIAATAIASGNPLATHNATDFDWIGELEVVDPVSSS